MLVIFCLLIIMGIVPLYAFSAFVATMCFLVPVVRGALKEWEDQQTRLGSRSERC